MTTLSVAIALAILASLALFSLPVRRHLIPARHTAANVKERSS